MPYETPLTAVAAAPFLTLPLDLHWKVILQGPLRPPSATPRNQGAAETLALYMHEVTRPPRATAPGGAYNATRHDYLSPHMLGLGFPAAPPGAAFLAASPGPVPYYTHGAGPMGCGLPTMSSPTMPVHPPASS